MSSTLGSQSVICKASSRIVDPARRAFRARIRFRAIVRLAYANKAWLLNDVLPTKKKKSDTKRYRKLTLKFIGDLHLFSKIELELFEKTRKTFQITNNLLAGLRLNVLLPNLVVLLSASILRMSIETILRTISRKDFKTLSETIKTKNTINYRCKTLEITHGNPPAWIHLRLSLNCEDKAILCANPIYRTKEDQERIYQIISFLKSFRKYPEYIVRQLSGVTHYAYFEANRTIVRQNHEAKAMYFLITGECVSYAVQYDKWLEEDIEISRVKIPQGVSFGEFCLLHHIPRNVTITTLTPCEFIYLKADDFNEILRDIIAHDWQLFMSHMNKFTYFNEWDAVTKRECCMVTKHVRFNRDDIILRQSEYQSGLPMVHFIISGQCAVIEFVMIHENIAGGVLNQTFFSTKEEDMVLKPHADVSTPLERSTSRITSARSLSKLSTERSRSCKSDEINLIKSNKKIGKVFDRLIQENEQWDYDTSSDEDDENGRKDEVKTKPLIFDIVYPADLMTYFVKICTYSELACFNVGENLRRRCVIATTDVECLLIPRYWLMARGWTNKWDMIKNYLNRQIPSNDKIYEEFLEQRKFKNFKKNFVTSLPHKTPCNCAANVPYSIRIKKDFEFESQH